MGLEVFENYECDNQITLDKVMQEENALTEQSRAEQSRAEQSRAEQSRAEQSRFIKQFSINDYLISVKGRVVETIERERAKLFVESIHYSRNLPNNTVYCFGLYNNNELIGVCTYGIPASPNLCYGVAGEKNRDKVLELNRLAILPKYNGGNEASYLISHSLKKLPNRTFVISYADTGWTHIGYVYQATNWLYIGLSEKRLDRYSGNYHPRSYYRNNAEQEEILYQTRNQKHRYIYLVGNKREKKEMLKELNYKVLNEYPKGNERKYDINNPQIAIPIKIIKK